MGLPGKCVRMTGRTRPNARTVRMFAGPNLQGFGATMCCPRGTQCNHVSELHEAYLDSDRVADSRIVQKFHSWSTLHCHWYVAQTECASAVRPGAGEDRSRTS